MRQDLIIEYPSRKYAAYAMKEFIDLARGNIDKIDKVQMTVDTKDGHRYIFVSEQSQTIGYRCPIILDYQFESMMRTYKKE